MKLTDENVSDFFNGEDNNPRCPDCKAETVFRVGKYGPFFGCAQYFVKGCQGKVGAYMDRIAKPFAVTSETRRAHAELFQKMQEFKSVSNRNPHRQSNQLKSILKSAVGSEMPRVVSLSKVQCEKAIDGIDVALYGKRLRKLFTIAKRILSGMWDD